HTHAAGRVIHTPGPSAVKTTTACGHGPLTHSQTHSHTLTCTPSLSLSLCLSHTHTLTVTHTHTHTHTRTSSLPHTQRFERHAGVVFDAFGSCQTMSAVCTCLLAAATHKQTQNTESIPGN